MWQFHVEVVDNNIRHTFTAQTDMKWEDFREEMHQYFDKTCGEVQVGFQISGEPSTMSYLESEDDWDDAVTRLVERMRAAWTRPVSMEIKNMVRHGT